MRSILIAWVMALVMALGSLAGTAAAASSSRMAASEDTSAASHPDSVLGQAAPLAAPQFQAPASPQRSRKGRLGEQLEWEAGFAALSAVGYLADGRGSDRGD